MTPSTLPGVKLPPAPLPFRGVLWHFGRDRRPVRAVVKMARLFDPGAGQRADYFQPCPGCVWGQPLAVAWPTEHLRNIQITSLLMEAIDVRLEGWLRLRAWAGWCPRCRLMFWAD